MTFYIKIDENNKPIDHPHLEENVKELYPDHDFSSPPAGWLEFIRKPPKAGAYQKFDESIGADIALAFPHNGLEYKLIDGKIEDYWHCIDMTDEEKKAQQDKVKAHWAALDPAGPASWSFDEATCRYKAPVDLPSNAWSETNPNGSHYKWNEKTTSWEQIRSYGQ